MWHAWMMLGITVSPYPLDVEASVGGTTGPWPRPKLTASVPWAVSPNPQSEKKTLSLGLRHSSLELPLSVSATDDGATEFLSFSVVD